MDFTKDKIEFKDKSKIILKNEVTKDRLTLKKVNNNFLINFDCVEGFGSLFIIEKKELFDFLNDSEIKTEKCKQR